LASKSKRPLTASTVSPRKERHERGVVVARGPREASSQKGKARDREDALASVAIDGPFRRGRD
jgi:hypothetical protein